MTLINNTDLNIRINEVNYDAGFNQEVNVLNNIAIPNIIINNNEYRHNGNAGFFVGNWIYTFQDDELGDNIIMGINRPDGRIEMGVIYTPEG